MSRADGERRCDVLIAGAGLVGLALAPALARAGLDVVLADRAVPVLPEPLPDSWDVRVYAISPGSAAWLHSIGAWQALPCERIAAIESMRIAGDDGALLNFSAYENGERALAWIVEERALRAALVPLVHAAGVEIAAPCAFDALTWSERCRPPRARGRHHDRRPPRRRSRRPALRRAPLGRHRRAGATLWPGRGGRQFRLRARASRPCPPVVPTGRQHPRLAAAAGTPRVDGLVGTRRAGGRAAAARAGRTRRARSRRRDGTRSAPSTA